MNAKIIQVVYNIVLRDNPITLSDRLKVRLAKKLFNKIIHYNPIVETYIGKFKLAIPFSHKLPFILKIFPHYSSNLVRIAKLAQEKYKDLKLIDVGANIGDSAALLRSEITSPILCIEGDDYFFSILKLNASRLSNVQIVKNYIGEVTENISAVSVELDGTARLFQNSLESQTVKIRKISDVVNRNPLFQYAKILKIDTDGFDNKILKGSVDFLIVAKPIIFFEYDPYFLSLQNDEDLSIFPILISVGYKKLLIYENNGEFLLSLDLSNTRLLEDITHFYRGRNGLRYCDICVFHEEDESLFETVREKELSYFEKSRFKPTY